MRCSLILVTLFAMIVGCTPTTETPSHIMVTFNHSSPAKVGPIEIVIQVLEENSPVLGAKVRIEGNMTHPGMAPIYAEAKESSAGQYQATLTTTMAGSWIAFTTIQMPEGEIIKKEFPFDVGP